MLFYKKLVCVFLLGVVGALPFAVVAHPEHENEEPLTEQRAAALADKSLPKLVSAKKVKPEWAQARRDSVAQRTISGKEFWVVTYKNNDSALYLFFDDLGNFIEVNQAGKLTAE
jgi:hypothetical protein